MVGDKVRAMIAGWVGRVPRRVRLGGVAAVVTGVLLWKVPQWQTSAWRAFLPPRELLLVENELRRTLVLLVGVLFGGVGLSVFWRRAAANERAARAVQDAHRAERFTRAVSQLADDRAEVRIGAVYGLEQIAAESPAQQGPVVEVLCALLRERAAWREGAVAPTPLPMDVQAVLTVLGRLRLGAPVGADGERRVRLDLRRTDLRGADLNGVHLERANLHEAHLDGASLQGAHLQAADLRGASLRNADLVEADLRGADLREARLDAAYLVEAHLEGADLGGAHLGGAYLGGAHLEGADLGGAYLDGAYMYQAHLDGASLHGARVVSAIGIARDERERINQTAADLQPEPAPPRPAVPPADSPAAPQPISLRQRQPRRV